MEGSPINGRQGFGIGLIAAFWLLFGLATVLYWGLVLTSRVRIPRSELDFLLPFAVIDLAIYAPLAVAAAIGIWRKRHWGMFLGLLLCGAGIYGVSAFFVFPLVSPAQPSLQSIGLLPLAGVWLAIALYLWRRRDEFR